MQDFSKHSFSEHKSKLVEAYSIMNFLGKNQKYRLEVPCNHLFGSFILSKMKKSCYALTFTINPKTFNVEVQPQDVM